MHSGVKLKLVCTKYLKKIQACITQEFKSEISKTKISKAHMNKISTTMRKSSRAHMKHNISRAFIPRNSKAIHKEKISRSHMNKISQACNVFKKFCMKNYDGQN
jgi:hypothetical protein